MNKLISYLHNLMRIGSFRRQRVKSKRVNDMNTMVSVCATPHTKEYMGAILNLAAVYTPAIAAPVNVEYNITWAQHGGQACKQERTSIMVRDCLCDPVSKILLQA